MAEANGAAPHVCVKAAVLGILLIASCAKRTPVHAPSLPSTPAAQAAIDTHTDLYELGLAAFREFTPEGYRRAIDYFARASDLAPDICEYRLHLAQSNLFLAFEEATNLEDFSSALKQSEPPACGADTPFALHLEALRSHATFKLGRERRDAIARLLVALERDPDNALNWFVAWELGFNMNETSSPILQGPEVSSDLALINYYRGTFWLFRGNAANARASFEKALQLSPRHFRSYLG